MKVILFLLTAGLTQAFMTPQATKSSPLVREMAPKFNGEKWETTDPSEGPEAGYPAYKTLLMHGPKPFFERAFRTDEYEQAVLKFMAGDKVDRQNAMGNMDAYLRNPNDWAFNRIESQKTGKVIDYTVLAPKNLILTLVWSVVVVFVCSRAVISIQTGEGFYDFL